MLFCSYYWKFCVFSEIWIQIEQLQMEKELGWRWAVKEAQHTLYEMCQLMWAGWAWTVQNFSCLLVVWLTWYQQCDISEASFIFHPGLLHYVCTKHLICVCYGCRGNLDGRLPIKYTFLHLPGGKMWVVYLYDFLAHFSCQQKGKFDTQLKFDVITITKH